MHLENINPNKRNTKFTVRGTTYWISHGGFIADPESPNVPLEIPRAHSDILLQGKAWQVLSWDPNDPKYAQRMMPAPTGKGLGRRPRTRDELKWDQGVRPKTPEELGGQPITVPTKDGAPTGNELIEKPVTDSEIQKAHEQTEAEVAAANAKELEQDTGMMADMQEAPEPPPATKKLVEPATPDEGEFKWAIPDEGDDWPDPVEKMPIEYLQKMAEAYEVKYTKRTGKKTLIKKIGKAMYE